MLDTCSKDVMFLIAAMVSPKEISNISSCSKWFRLILPTRPLRIRIIKTRTTNMDNNDVVVEEQDHCLLDPYFFVSEYSSGRLLNHEDSLYYGQSYRFWQFDYEQCNRVLLMQHLPVHLVDAFDSYVSHGFDITLVARPLGAKVRTPNTQTWKIIDPYRDENDESKNENIMPWGSVVNLTIGGEIQNNKYNCEFWSRSYLTSIPIEDNEDKSILWYSNSELGENTRLRILPEDGCNDLVLLNKGNNDSSSILSGQDLALTKRKKKQKLTIGTTYTTLNIRAVPVLHHGIGIYGIYSAQSLKRGSIEFNGREQDNVEFELWTEKGHLLVEAAAHYHMPFRLVVPMRRKKETRPNTHNDEVCEYDQFYFCYKEHPDEHPLLEVMANLRRDYSEYVRFYLQNASAGDYTAIHNLLNGIYDPDMGTFTVTHDLIPGEVEGDDDDNNNLQENNGEENDIHTNDVGDDDSNDLASEDSIETFYFSPWEKEKFANIPKDSSRKFFCVFVRKTMQTYDGGVIH